MYGFSEQANVAGYDWLQAFRNRHSHHSTRKPENFSLSRAMNLNEVVVKQHFDESFKVMSDNNITGHRVWNTVETGLQEVFESCDVIGSSQSRAFNFTGREKRRNHNTCASGGTAPHMIILKGKREDLQKQAAIRDLVRVSESGWIKDSKMTEWGHNFLCYLQQRAHWMKRTCFFSMDAQPIHRTLSLSLKC